MSFYRFLELPKDKQEEMWKQARQEEASRKVDELGNLIMSEARAIGKMVRKNNEPAGEV